MPNTKPIHRAKRNKPTADTVGLLLPENRQLRHHERRSSSTADAVSAGARAVERPRAGRPRADRGADSRARAGPHDVRPIEDAVLIGRGGARPVTAGPVARRAARVVAVRPPVAVRPVEPAVAIAPVPGITVARVTAPRVAGVGPVIPVVEVPLMTRGPRGPTCRWTVAGTGRPGGSIRFLSEGQQHQTRQAQHYLTHGRLLCCMAAIGDFRETLEAFCQAGTRPA